MFLDWPTIHPYIGIVRIRLEGIISAHTREHPLIIGDKGNENREQNKKKQFFFLPRCILPYLKVRFSEQSTKWKLAFVITFERKYLHGLP